MKAIQPWPFPQCLSQSLSLTDIAISTQVFYRENTQTLGPRPKSSELPVGLGSGALGTDRPHWGHLPSRLLLLGEGLASYVPAILRPLPD